MKVNSISWKILNPKLYKDCKESEEYIKNFKADNVFTSGSMEELFTDTFTYNGNKPNKILVKNKLTGEPVELNVEYNIKPMLMQTGINDKKIEEIFILDNDGNELGYKYFFVQNGQMYPGYMTAKETNYIGLGTRLDQLQIERALELGLECINRIALPKAIIYHVSRGFLPKDDYTNIKVKNHRDFVKLSPEYIYPKESNITTDSFVPILKRGEENIFLDIAWSKLITVYNACKKIITSQRINRIQDDVVTSYLHLSLSGDELNYWKSLIEGKRILPNIIKNIF
ncbi:MAG: hypothetical protein MJ231_08305 [bacterium]|nr:hypothetical protein [bacterium]